MATGTTEAIEETKRADLSSREGVMSMIEHERILQEQKWGAAHDYAHSAVEWSGIATKYLGRAVDAKSLDEAQHALIQAAAVCAAAAQAMELWRYGASVAEALNVMYERRTALTQAELAQAQTPDDYTLPDQMEIQRMYGRLDQTKPPFVRDPDGDAPGPEWFSGVWVPKAYAYQERRGYLLPDVTVWPKDRPADKTPGERLAE